MENPFALPPPLFSRKRKAASAAESAPFITEDAYHLYSISGHAREAEAFQGELNVRDTVRKALASHSGEPTKQIGKPQATEAKHSIVADIKPVAAALHGTVVGPTPAKPVRHLALVLLDKAEKEGWREMAQVQNVSRRLSSIPVSSHVEFSRLDQKRSAALAGGIPAVLALTPEEQETWNRLEKIVREEQSTFATDVERLAKKEKLAAYTFVPPHIDQLFERRLQSCRNQVMHLYPRYYDAQLVVKLHNSKPSPAERNASTMKHLQEVMSEGSRPTMKGDLLNQELNVDPRSGGIDLDDVGIQDSFGSWKAISADPVAERLMEAHECDVAMSSSTLLAIFDTAVEEVNLESSGWTIPVKSRVCIIKGKPRRQIYLDRPLINQEVSAREKISSVSRTLASNYLTDSVRGHVTYHIWQMSDTRILLRAETHAFASDSSSQVKRPVSIFIKPDHKPLGINERVSPSEFRRMWLHSWIRGGSTIAIGRLNPATSAITTWSKYALPDFLHSLGSSGFPAAFEPFDYFVVLQTVLTSLQGLPSANFLLRSHIRSDVKRKDRELEILRAATETDDESDHSHHFDLFQHINSCGTTSSDFFGYVLPSWPSVPHRIPYTYRTGSHCPEFLQRGVCGREGMGETCDLVHLRLVFSKNKIEWVFEDLSTTQAAKRAMSRLTTAGGKKQYPRVSPRFSFCCGPKGLHPSKILTSAHLPLRCENPNECGKPHYSLHEIAERVADDELRAARAKRRTHKSKNKSRARERDQQQHQSELWEW